MHSICECNRNISFLFLVVLSFDRPFCVCFCCYYDLENTVFRDDGHIMFYIDAKPSPVTSY